MWLIALKAVWTFFTSKIGAVILILSLLTLSVWQIYEAGARSEINNAKAIVDKGKKDADKKVADIQAQLDELSNEKKQWRQDMDAAVTKAKNAQKDILEGLKSRVAELEKQKSTVKTIIKEVPKYVTVKADSQCNVTSGFVWLYDATLQASTIPGSGPTNADASSGIAISRVAEIAGRNNAECVERGEIITLWQQWYYKVKKLHDELVKKANSRR